MTLSLLVAIILPSFFWLLVVRAEGRCAAVAGRPRCCTRAQVRTTHVETKSTEFGQRQAVLLAEKKEDSVFRWIRIVVRCVWLFGVSDVV